MADFSTPTRFVELLQKNGQLPNGYPPKTKSTHMVGFRWACQELGIGLVRTDKRSVHFFKGLSVVGSMRGMMTSLVSQPAARVCRNKRRTLIKLSESGVPTPRCTAFTADEQGMKAAMDYWATYGLEKGIVMKPSRGAGGAGITVGIKDEDSFFGAWETAIKSSDNPGEILLEERIEGCDFRVIVVAGRFVCAATRIPPYVVGDGISSVATLISRKNKERALHPHHWRFPLIHTENLNPHYVPDFGNITFLSHKANIHQGGESADVTDVLPASVTSVAEDSVRAIPGLGVAGVDIIYSGDPLQEPKVIEINTSANFGIHYFPMFGNHQNPAKAIIEEMLLLSETREPQDTRL